MTFSVTQKEHKNLIEEQKAVKQLKAKKKKIGARLALPFLKKLGINQRLSNCLQEYGIYGKSEQMCNRTDVLIAQLLGLMSNNKTFDEMDNNLRGRCSYGNFISKDKILSVKTIKRRLAAMNDANFVKKVKQAFTRCLEKVKAIHLSSAMNIDFHFIAYRGKENISKGYITDHRLAVKDLDQHFLENRLRQLITFVLTSSNIEHRSLPKVVNFAVRVGQDNSNKHTSILAFNEQAHSVNVKLFKRSKSQNIAFISCLKNASKCSKEKIPFTQSATNNFRAKQKKYELLTITSKIRNCRGDPKTGYLDYVITN